MNLNIAASSLARRRFTFRCLILGAKVARNGFARALVVVSATIFGLCSVTGAEPLARGFAVNLGDMRLRTAEEYDYPRSPPGFKGNTKDITMESFGLAFWMPDLAPLEGSAFSNPDRRPRESSRPHPGPDEYIVIVRTFARAKAYEAKGSPSPETALRNLERWLVSYDLIDDHGLKRLLPAGPAKLPTATWFDFSDANTSADLSCFLEGEAPNPGCLVRLVLNDFDIYAVLDIPADARYQVPKIAAGIRTLLRRWIEK